MKFACAAVLLSLVCSLQFPAISHAADSGAVIRQAIDAYNSKRYHAAEDLLTEALSINPSDQNAHFWMGKTLEQLLDAKAAKAEYENCYKINPFSPTGINARKASMDVAGRTASEAAAPLDDVKTVTKTTQIINAQANDLKGRYQAWGQTGSDWRMGQINNNIYGGTPWGNTYNPGNYVNNGRYNQYNQGNQYPGAYYPNNNMGGGFNNAYNPNNNQAYNPGYPNGNYGNGRYGYQNPWARNNNWVSNVNQINQSYLRSDGQVQAYKYRTAATTSAAAAQESANNLENLLADKPVAGQPHLRATGTNLFVRYYGDRAYDGNQISTPPADPVEELHATAQRLSNASFAPIKTERVSSASVNARKNYAHTDLGPLPADLRVQQPDPPAVMSPPVPSATATSTSGSAAYVPSPPAPVSSVTGLPDAITGAPKAVSSGDSSQGMVATPKTLGMP